MALFLFYFLQVVVRFHVSLWPCSTGRFCGGRPPSLILIAGSHSITLQFVSDVSSTGAGFAIQFSGVDKDYNFGELNLFDWFLVVVHLTLKSLQYKVPWKWHNNACRNLKIQACLVTVQCKCRISCAAVQYSHHASPCIAWMLGTSCLLTVYLISMLPQAWWCCFRALPHLHVCVSIQSCY